MEALNVSTAMQDTFVNPQQLLQLPSQTNALSEVIAQLGLRFPFYALLERMVQQLKARPQHMLAYRASQDTTALLVLQVAPP